MGEPGVATVVVSFNTRDLTLRALESVLASTGVTHHVLVVDNASTDGSAAAVRERFPQVGVVELPHNVGFGRGNNAALERVDAPYVLLLNSDARFADVGGLRRLVDAMAADAGVGVAGPRLESPAGQLEFSARAFPGIVTEIVRGTGLHRLLGPQTRAQRLGGEFHAHRSQGDMDWLTGACLLVRGDVLRQVGGFDPEIFLYGEELEWCWRVREAGWRIVFVPDVTVVHERGASSAAAPARRLRLAQAGDAYAVRKHRGRAYFAAFFVARCVGLAAEVVIQGVLGLLTGSAPRSERARHALRSLGAWTAAVAGGGALHPGRFAPGGGAS